MRIIGVVCELNPMHQGHLHLIRSVKQPDDIVVGVLSGPFVQRGEPALLDKWDRARIALYNGFDLILELPTAACLQSADSYAASAVALLQAIGMDHLAFGSEPPFNAPFFRKTADKLRSEECQKVIRKTMREGVSYRRAVAHALHCSLTPNALLGLSYVQALSDTSTKILVVPRRGGDHHSAAMHGTFSSATALRAKLYRAKKEGHIDKEVRNCLADRSLESLLQRHFPRLDDLNAYVQTLLLLQDCNWSASPHYEPGMGDRLVRFMQATNSLEEACRRSANKRHTASRYRRLLLTMLLQIQKAPEMDALYLRPLAVNQKATFLLRNAALPVFQRPRARTLTEAQDALFRIDLRAQALYEHLAHEKKGRDYREHPFYDTNSL